jgi:Glycosyl hydrolase family 30 beta sandwich domain
LPTSKPTWMSEYGLGGTTWNEAWDAGGPSAAIVLANDIHDALTQASVNAYVTWFGASLGATRAPIQLDGENYHVSKRLYATAAYSRFIRPGAYRVPAETSGRLLKVSAFRNADGGKVVNILNNRASQTRLDLTLDAATAGSRVAAYRTDEEHSLSPVDTAALDGAKLTVNLAPRSLTTVILSPCDTTVTGRRTGALTARHGVTCLAEGSTVVGPITVKPGASLVTSDATIIGPIASDRAGAVELVGSRVVGPVSIKDSTKRVRISGASIIGPVRLTGNHTGFAPLVVSGSQITGSLTCRHNEPPPTNEGTPNTVHGPTSGQCANL